MTDKQRLLAKLEEIENKLYAAQKEVKELVDIVLSDKEE